MPLSARNPDALREIAAAYADLLSVESASTPDFDALCHAMAVRRSHHRNRLAVVADGAEQANDALRAFIAGDLAPDVVSGDVAADEVRPVFVFTGMGPQWWAMGRQLLAEESAFEAAARAADEAFRACAGWSILEQMLAEKDNSRMASNEIAQPANFIIQVGLFVLWRSWGITPAAIIGHSVGEVAAAYAAGCLSLEDAARISFHRSQCQQTVAGEGTMLAVGLPPDTAASLVALYPGRVSVASINSPSSVALAGDAEALQEISDTLKDDDVFNRLLRVEVAYHSHQMDPLETDLKERLADLSPKPPIIPLVSTVTGERVTTALHDADYWWRNVRQPVRFQDAAATALGDGFELFVEVGPHPVLSAAIKETAVAAGKRVEVLYSLKRGDNERKTALATLARLYCLGLPIRWNAFHGDFCRHMRLPLYPWQRERHWTETDRSANDRLPSVVDPLLGQATPGPGGEWRASLTHNAAPYLWDHRVDGMVVFPGAGYVQMMLAAQQAYSPEGWGVIEDIRFDNALVLGDSDKPILETRISDKGDSISVFGQRAGDGKVWSACARAALSRATVRREATPVDIAALRAALPVEIAPDILYRDLSARGLDYGPYFRCIKSLRRRDGEVLVEIAADQSLAIGDDFAAVHATMLDASFQALIAALDEGDKAEAADAVFVPVSIDRFSLFDRVPARVWCHGRLTHRTADGLSGEIVLFDDQGRTLARVEGFRCQAVPRAAADRQGDPMSRWFYRYEWREAPPADSADAAQVESGEWIIVSGDDRFGDDVAARFKLRDIDYLQVRQGAGFEYDGGDLCRMSLHSPDHWRRLFEARSDRPLAGVAYMGGIENPSEESDPTGIATCTAALTLLQNLVEAKREDPPRLFLVTRGIYASAGGENSRDAVHQYGLWGLGRVIMNEHPELRCSLVDLDVTYNDSSIDDLVREFLADSPEDEVAIRDGQRSVNRLIRTAAPAGQEAAPDIRPATVPFELQAAAPGELNSVRFVECERRPPDAGEVELRIIGVSLNFKDLLKIMGVLSTEVTAGTFFGTAVGMEAAVEVLAVGDGVSQYDVGDKLIATLPGGCFRSYATVAAKDVHGVPALPGYDHLALAGLPISFVTAYYGLFRIANLQKGERVLLHSASGSVGQAAIQVAQWLGAEIYATAGSDRKRDYLRELGVEHIYDSRSLHFADEIRADTGGEGVDVVLNFLPGEAQKKSVSLLAPFGRFIEIGKRDIDENRGLGLRPFNRNLTFAAIDIDRMIAEKPALFDALLRDVWNGLEDGRFRPVSATTYPISDFLDACRVMQRAEHIGKILLHIEGESLPVVPIQREEPLFRADATYMITGGFGGFGLKVADWMADEGARNLVLVGRSGAAGDEARDALARMTDRGINIVPVAADVSDADALENVIRGTQEDETLPPLRGVFHAAAVLDDAFLVQLNAERFAQVMKAKAEGAWFLHRLTEKLELDYFVLFSSVAALVGNPGQGNYVAANAFLDRLAGLRARRGLPATSINWGAIADVGMAARDPSVEASLKRLGVGSLSPHLAVDAMGRVLRLKEAQIGIMEVEWERWRQSNPAAGASPKFAELMTAESATAGGASVLVDALAPLSAEQRRQYLIEGLSQDIAEVLRMAADRLDIDRPLTDMGVDSLMMVEVQLAIERRVGLGVTVMELSRGFSVAKLADHLLQRLAAEAGLVSAIVGAGGRPPQATNVNAVDDISDSEVEALLNKLLEDEEG